MFQSFAFNIVYLCGHDHLVVAILCKTFICYVNQSAHTRYKQPSATIIKPTLSGGLADQSQSTGCNWRVIAVVSHGWYYHIIIIATSIIADCDTDHGTDESWCVASIAGELVARPLYSGCADCRRLSIITHQPELFVFWHVVSTDLGEISCDSVLILRKYVALLTTSQIDPTGSHSQHKHKQRNNQQQQTKEPREHRSHYSHNISHIRHSPLIIHLFQHYNEVLHLHRRRLGHLCHQRPSFRTIHKIGHPIQ